MYWIPWLSAITAGPLNWYVGGLWAVTNYAARFDGSTPIQVIHDTLRSSRELLLRTFRHR
jgi:hypothetical protein